MAHIQISETKWINTALIEHVEIRHISTNVSVVDVSMSRNQYSFCGSEAEAFLEAYERLCVAKPRPEVG